MNFDEYIKDVVKTAKMRKRLHPGFSELDFFMGAGILFSHLSAMDKVPSCWIFGPMSDRDILSFYEEEEIETQ